MKIFLIKTGVIFFAVLVLFKLTVGSLYNSLQKKFDEQFSKEQIMLIKDKIREEMRKGIEKDKILNDDDAKLIQEFIKKLLKEIN
jgi:1,2-phenylacetyl-CoA epoxidase catalytic subunit|tara:strand:+ start:205 stop:459 length:255 start_codon:yes stop_codon:yes gene_type:complete